jgi:hypothetical protein
VDVQDIFLDSAGIITISDRHGNEIMAFRLTHESLRVFVFQAMGVLLRQESERPAPSPPSPSKLEVV